MTREELKIILIYLENSKNWNSTVDVMAVEDCEECIKIVKKELEKENEI